MSAKDRVREVLDGLPDDCTLDEVVRHLRMLQAEDHHEGPSTGRIAELERLVGKLRARKARHGTRG